MADWNFAAVFEAVATVVPDRPAIVQGTRVVPWSELDRRAGALAADLLEAGLEPGAKIAAYLHNGPEYLETYLAAFQAALAPVNCNYRYGPTEMRYLLDNADTEAVVFHASFADVVDEIRHELPKVRRWYVVDDGLAPLPAWAIEFELAVAGDRRPRGAARSPDDLLLLYTGGTTGMPKGVMWRQDDLFTILGGGGHALLGLDPAADADDLVARVQGGEAPIGTLVACPLMHGTGQFSALQTLATGGTVVLLPGRSFDADELLNHAAAWRVDSLIIVGQTFGGALVDRLRAHPGRWDLGALRLITSSGVMWGQENKDALLELLPHVLLFDSFGSSEAIGVGASLSRKGSVPRTADFGLGPNSAVFTEDGRRVEPGSGERGLVAVTGPMPVGYYKDEAKTAATFREFEGRRWSVPGDWAEVTIDGRVKLLGRGSQCVNTGGEKVFPEEVEEALKTHPAVHDAVVVGVPDGRLGEAICAVVEGEHADDAELIAHVKARLAGYKAPRHIVRVDAIGRAPNGKADPQRLRALAIETIGATT